MIKLIEQPIFQLPTAEEVYDFDTFQLIELRDSIQNVIS
jgi:hypothetical protein